MKISPLPHLCRASRSTLYRGLAASLRRAPRLLWLPMLLCLLLGGVSSTSPARSLSAQAGGGTGIGALSTLLGSEQAKASGSSAAWAAPARAGRAGVAKRQTPRRAFWSSLFDKAAAKAAADKRASRDRTALFSSFSSPLSNLLFSAERAPSSLSGNQPSFLPPVPLFVQLPSPVPTPTPLPALPIVPARILIYGPSMSFGFEKSQALLDGHTVTVVTAAQWSQMTAADFRSYDAIVFGEGFYWDRTQQGQVTPAGWAVEANREVWSPVVTGPKILIGTDPSNPHGVPMDVPMKMIRNGINFAASRLGSTTEVGTGLYVCLFSNYHSAPDGTQITWLRGIGDFRVKGSCSNNIRIVDTSHPAMKGLTDAALSNWNCSGHEVFTGYPRGFKPLVVAEEDSVANIPYIIATGVQEPCGDPEPPPPLLSFHEVFTTPTVGERVSSLALLAGHIKLNLEVSRCVELRYPTVSLTIQRRSDGLYWSGTTWVSRPLGQPVEVAATVIQDTGFWSYGNGPAGDALPDGVYNLTVNGISEDGFSVSGETISVTVDKTTVRPITEIVQADGQISDCSDCDLDGNNVYNLDAAQQTSVQQVPAGTKATYRLKIENDSLLPGVFTIFGTKGNSDWDVDYFDAEGKKITAQVTQVDPMGPYPVPFPNTETKLYTLQPGEALNWRVEVTPNSSLAANKALNVWVRASTISNSTGVDVGADMVKARTVVGPPPTPTPDPNATPMPAPAPTPTPAQPGPTPTSGPNVTPTPDPDVTPTATPTPTFDENVCDCEGESLNILSPEDGSEITKPTGVTINVTDVERWELSYRLIDGDTPYRVFASGTGAAPNFTPPQKFDPTLLLNGLYRIKLVGYSGGGTAFDYHDVVVKGGMKLGHFTMSFKDMTLPVAGLPIEVTRTYDSRDPRRGDFGTGWTLSLNDVRLQKNGPVGGLSRPGGEDFEVWQASTTGTSWSWGELRPRIVTITLPGDQVYSFRAVLQGEHNQGGSYAVANVAWVPQPGTRVQDNTSLKSVDTGHDSEVYVTKDLEDGTTLLYNNSPGEDGDGSVYDPKQWELTLPDGRVFNLSETGDLSHGGRARLNWVKDYAGNKLVFDYHSNGTSKGIRSVPAGASDSEFLRQVIIRRDAATGFISAIEDPKGQKVLYRRNEPDNANDPINKNEFNLTSFEDREGAVTRFFYESPDLAYPHYVTKIVDPRGYSALRHVYGDDGRLDHSLDAFGKKTKYHHDLNQGTETITDRYGFQTQLKYDAFGNVTETGKELKEVKNGVQSTRLVKSQSTYDLSGKNPDLPTSTTQVLVLPDETTKNLTTYYEYNDFGSPIKVTDPEGYVTTTTYNDRQQVLTVSTYKATNPPTPAKVVTNNTYITAPQSLDGPQGALLSSSDALGNTTSYQYFATGALKRVTDAQNRGTSYGMSGGMVTRIETPSNITLFSYDANGNKIGQSTARTKSDGTTETLTTAYEYDKENRVIRTEAPDGTVSATAYNAIGKVDSSTVAKGTTLERKTFYRYDELGRRIKTIYPDGTFTETAYPSETGETYSVNYQESIDRARRRTRTTYDGLGRAIKTQYLNVDGSEVKDSAGNTVFTETEYDDAGRAIASRDERGYESYTSYDDAGNVVATKDALGHITGTQYDADGRVWKVTDAKNRVTTNTYDAAGRMTRTTFPKTSSQQEATFTETVYDKLNRAIATRDGGGKWKRNVYDSRGNLVAVVVAAALVTENGQEVPDGSGRTGMVTRFGYDELGNKVWQQDAKGYLNEGRPPLGALPGTASTSRVTRFSYDSRGRLIRRTLPNGKYETMTYLPTGQMESKTDFRGVVTNFVYDKRGRMISKSSGAEALTWVYDGELKKTAERRITTTTGTTTNTTLYSTVYLYDSARGWLSSVSNSSSVTGRTSIVKYWYDAAGNKVATEIPKDNEVSTTRYAYDALNRMERVAESSPARKTAAVTAYEYDEVGNKVRVSHANGVVTAYTYDSLNRLIDLVNVLNGTTLSAFQYEVRGDGKRIGVVENWREPNSSGGGATARSITYTYDAAGRLTNEDVTRQSSGQAQTGRNTSYGYDAVGNRITSTVVTNQGTTTTTTRVDSSYNDNDHLTDTKTTVNGVATTSSVYYYDDNGAQISQSSSDHHGTTVTNKVWDFEGRLRQVSGPGSVTKYAYDAGGLRLESSLTRNNQTTTTRYLNDESQPYAQVVEEYLYDTANPNGVLQARYGYGQEAGPVVQEQRTQNTDGSFSYPSSYYLVDGLDSTRQLTDGAGTVTDSYSYDAFGDSESSSGTTPNSYLFNGQQLDGGTGGYYLRARYYTPWTGRFLSHDPLMGSEQDPVSMHRYLYAGNDPVNHVDPSGESFVSAALIGASIGTILPMAVYAVAYQHRIDMNVAMVPRTGDPKSETVVNSIRFKTTKSLDQVFDQMSTFEDFPPSEASVDGTPVTGVGDTLFFRINARLANFTGNDVAPVNVYKYNPAQRIFAVETLTGHPLMGWRYWRVYGDKAGNTIIETVGIEHPRDRRDAAMLWAQGGRQVQLRSWELLLRNLQGWAGGTPAGGEVKGTPNYPSGDVFVGAVPKYVPLFAPAKP